MFLCAYTSYSFGKKLGKSGCVMNYLRSILMIQFLMAISQYSTVSLLCHQYQVSSGIMLVGTINVCREIG